MEEKSFLIPAAVFILAILIGSGAHWYVGRLSAPPAPPLITTALANSPTPQSEYVTLSITPTETPILVTGLGLMQESLLVPIGDAIRTFVRGQIDTPRPIVATKESHIFINSGRSPIGVSFRVNKCSGFLSERQTFVPPLKTSCPSTLELLDKEGVVVSSECRDYFANTPLCVALPENVPVACRSTLIENVGYNQCVENFKNDTDFYTNEWRLYLESANSLWATSSPVQMIDQNKEFIGPTGDTR